MSSTYQDMHKWIGRTGSVRTGHGTMTCDVVIVDAKVAYGKARVSVEPLKGYGGAWVDVESFTPTPANGKATVIVDAPTRIGGGA